MNESVKEEIPDESSFVKSDFYDHQIINHKNKKETPTSESARIQ